MSWPSTANLDVIQLKSFNNVLFKAKGSALPGKGITVERDGTCSKT